MLLDVLADFLKVLAGRLETLLEFRLAFTLPSPSAICTRLWALTSPSPKSRWAEDHIFEFIDDRGLHSSDCDDGMQPKGFNASTMWQSL